MKKSTKALKNIRIARSNLQKVAILDLLGLWKGMELADQLINGSLSKEELTRWVSSIQSELQTLSKDKERLTTAMKKLQEENKLLKEYTQRLQDDLLDADPIRTRAEERIQELQSETAGHEPDGMKAQQLAKSFPLSEPRQED